MAGISGSTVIGDHVVMGGRVSFADHVSVGDGAILAANSGVISDVPAGAKWAGFPAGPWRDWKRAMATERLARKRRTSKESE
jgi:UDP-3-O-[3-hydroxymyristoyl] glucosamine N-acyltransferase